MITCAENTIKSRKKMHLREKKKYLPTTLNCFLILEKPKGKKKCILNISKLLVNKQIHDKLRFRLHRSPGLKRIRTPKQ